MKKLVLLVASLAISTGVFSQNNSGKGIVGLAEPITNLHLKQNSSAATMQQANSPAAKTIGINPQVQSISCGDTLRYVQTKQILLYPGGTGASNFATFTVYRSDNEAVAQTFKHSGGTSVSIKGVEFYGNKHTSSAAGALIVRASIYSVDANNAPLTSLGSRTISITSTTAGYRYAIFTTPITVTGDYAVVLEATSTNGILQYYVTSPATGEAMDGENLAHYKSSYYTLSLGSWVTIPTLTTGDATNFPSGPYDFEPLISPIVSYNINTAFTATPNSLCLGAPVTITNNTTPTDLLKNRMYNYGSFMHYFNQYPQDSLYLWDMGDGSPLIWDVNTAYTYTAAGTYTAAMGTAGGFWHSCFDVASTTVTVNALPNVVATPASTAVCVGTTISLTGGGASTYTWTGGVTNGVAFNPTSTSYTVTGTSVSGCTNTTVASVTVNSLPNVTANTSTNTICAGSPVTLTGGGASTYTWVPGDLADGSSVTPATNITYTVAGTDANGCISISTTAITVNDLPVVTASATATAVCEGANVTLTGGGATTYTWSGSVVDGVAFAPASTDIYTVTGTDANGCQNYAEIALTVNNLPAVTANASAAVVCTGDEVTLSGGGATSYTWSAGVVDNTPFAPVSTDTYTVTGEDVNGCSSTATVEVTVSTCTGIQSLSNAASSVIVFPNPSNGTFTVKSYKSDVINLTNELGQVVRTIGLNQENNFSAEIGNLESGVYFLVGKSVKQKVIVTK